MQLAIPEVLATIPPLSPSSSLTATPLSPPDPGIIVGSRCRTQSEPGCYGSAAYLHRGTTRSSSVQIGSKQPAVWEERRGAAWLVNGISRLHSILYGAMALKATAVDRVFEARIALSN
jgi:hypothetical protein